jgi:hypothetical protein
MGALAAAALASAAAGAAPVVVGDSGLVIEVEFWGRQQIREQIPGTNDDIIRYGDPVNGSFRIFADDAPEPSITSFFLDYQDARIYGQDRFAGNQGSFVTSRWLSPLPEGFAHEPGPFPGSVESDYVTIGDDVRFRPEEPIKDWFIVSDTFDDDGEPGGLEESLTMQVRTPLAGVIDGVGLDQEFELVNDMEDGGFSFGRLQTLVDGTNKVFDFVVDRLRVSSSSVCRP